MKKNVLFLHLESISRANLWQYRNELGTLWRLMSESLQFSRFFTSATSTTMSINDLWFGDAGYADACPVYSTSRFYASDEDKYRTLLSECVSCGYKALSFGSSPYFTRYREFDEKWHRVNNPDLSMLCKEAISGMLAAKNAGKPFLAYFWDASSHLAFPSPFKDAKESVPERLRVAYSLIDASLNRLLADMAKSGILNDTIVIGFGDHGDEAWGHNLNRGYCHSIIPYASVTWTPMFIYDPERFKPAIDESLASMVDIRPTVFGMLFPDTPSVVKGNEYSGIDLFTKRRKFAFSQNMFALQKEYSDPEKGMIKGYGVVDGSYRLVVSSGGNNPNDGGMALYCDQADPSNSLNLLKFFKLNRQGCIKEYRPPQDAIANHFLSAFGEPQVKSLIAAYERLRPELVRFIERKESAALEEYSYWRDTPVETLAGQLSLKRKSNAANELPVCVRIQNSMREHQYQTFPRAALASVKPERVGLL